MDFHSGPLDPGSPDGDPRFGGSDPFVPDDGDYADRDEGAYGDHEDGPLHPWLPPEDRLWRHPSEGAPVIRIDDDFAAAGRHHGRATATLAGLGPATWRTTCAIAVIAGLVGAAAVSGIAFAGGWWHQTTVIRSPLTFNDAVPAVNATSTDSVNWTEADRMVADAVVSVTVAGADGTEEGSGVVLFTDAAGDAYVVTDYGLIAPSILAGEANPKMAVSFASGTTTTALIVGSNSMSRIAVLVVPNARNTPAANIGTVASLTDVQQVMAVGSRASGVLANGLISEQDQSVTLGDNSDLDNLIKVSMPGMTAAGAGAPLIDAAGNVIGITLAIQPTQAADQTFTYAEPINEAFPVAWDIINAVPVTHAWLGITNTDDLTTAVAQQLHLSGGVSIGQVTAGSPAAQAGIQVNDVLTSFDGRSIDSAGAFVAALAECTPGSRARVGWEHDGLAHSTTLVLGSEPTDAP